MDRGHLEFCTEVQRKYLEAYLELGNYEKVAERFGVRRQSVSASLAFVRRKALKRGYAPEQQQTHPVPEKQYVKGVSTLYDEEGNVKLQWVKSANELDDLKECLQDFANGLCEEIKGRANNKIAPRLDFTDDIALYGIGDHHIGMYAWAEETGTADYDTAIASELLRNAFDYLVDRSPPTEVGIFCNVGDWLHANDSTSLTPASKNILDTDTRFAYVIPRAAELQKYCIDRMLDKHEKVVIANASGNHDPDASIWVNQVTKAYYHNEPRVKVLNNARKFIHFKFGKVLIIITHGDKINQNRLYEAVTRDFRQEMSECDYIYVITGHIHHKVQYEMGGILFESMNTLAPPDAWHASSGYNGRRELQMLLMSKEYGIKSRNIYSLCK